MGERTDRTERSQIYDVSVQDMFATIIDYETYPKFLDGVDDIKVLENTADGARVEYQLDVVKRFAYVIKLHHEAPNRVWWELETGDLFRVNSGEWKLEDLGNGKTKVTYGLSLEFKLMVPKMILSSLIGFNLPSMMDAMADEAKKRKK